MRQFIMNGKAITSPMRFREHFDPRELLRSRELAAGFCLQQFRGLTPKSYYHAEVFYIAACCNPQTHPNPDANIYCAYTDTGFLVGTGFGAKEMVSKHLAGKDARQLRESLWQLVQETGLEQEDRIRLFLLLTAAYSMAARTPETCPLTPQEAEAAFLRQDPAQKKRDPWLTFADSGDVRLAASEEPYKILMAAGARELLAQGNPIVHRKIAALPHEQGDVDIPLTLELYHDPDQPPFRRLKIAVGDYRYFNFVKNIPVHYHPRLTMVRAGGTDISLGRVGSNLVYTRGNDATSIPIRGGLELYACALEPDGGGYILLTNDGVRYNQYSRKNAYFYLPEKDIVEIAFRGSDCLLLDKTGYVRIPGSGYRNSTPVICLDEIPHKQK